MLKYPLSVAEFNMLLKYQRYSCAICMTSVRGNVRGKRKAHVDHDHSTGNVRGILCRACNFGLGCFQDNIRLLSAAIVYLDDSKPLQEVFGLVDEVEVEVEKADKRAKLLALAEEWGMDIEDLQKPNNALSTESNKCSPSLSEVHDGPNENLSLRPLRLSLSEPLPTKMPRGSGASETEPLRTT